MAYLQSVNIYTHITNRNIIILFINSYTAIHPSSTSILITIIYSSHRNYEMKFIVMKYDS